MKKSIQKLAINKKAISNLSKVVKGGIQREWPTEDPFDPTANTWCYVCPDDPVDTF